jgi:hypothetical protein
MKSKSVERQPTTGRKPTMLAQLAGVVLGVYLVLSGAAAHGQALNQAPPPTKYNGKDLLELKPPSLEQLFRLDSEHGFLDRMRRESLQSSPPRKLILPSEPPPSMEGYVPRSWEPRAAILEPSYVCYRRMYFEQLNSERYGWDLGYVQPVISLAHFWWDTLIWPYQIGVDPCRRCECSAGYFLPGDPVPLLAYLPEPSVTGALAEAGVITGWVFLFNP